MAWTTPFTATTGATLTAARFNAEIRDNMHLTEVGVSLNTGKPIISTGANTVIPRELYRDSQLQLGTTTSTTYTDLEHDGDRSNDFGPAVTLTTGTTAVAWFSARMGVSGANVMCAYSVAVEDSAGTEYVAASDEWCGKQDGVTAASGGLNQECKNGICHRFTGLTAGKNTFVMKYKVSSGTGNFSNREMFVMAL